MFREAFDGFVGGEVVQGEEDVVRGGEAGVCEAGGGVVVAVGVVSGALGRSWGEDWGTDVALMRRVRASSFCWRSLSFLESSSSLAVSRRSSDSRDSTRALSLS